MTSDVRTSSEPTRRQTTNVFIDFKHRLLNSDNDSYYELTQFEMSKPPWFVASLWACGRSIKPKPPWYAAFLLMVMWLSLCCLNGTSVLHAYACCNHFMGMWLVCSSNAELRLFDFGACFMRVARFPQHKQRCFGAFGRGWACNWCWFLSPPSLLPCRAGNPSRWHFGKAGLY